MTCPARRTVFKGAAVVCGGSLLAACGSGSEEDTAPPPASGGAGVRASLGALDDIPVGGAVSATAPDGKKVLLVRPTADEVIGLSAICTHQGCTVVPDGDALGCPCHGSVYELTGEVRRGPAEESLAPFAVKVFGGQVLPA